MGFLIYNTENGMIETTGNTDIYKRMVLDINQEILVSNIKARPNEEYINVDSGKIIDRPELNIKWNKTFIEGNGIDTASCELEEGCDVLISIPGMFFERFISDGSKLEINSTIETDVIVTIIKFPYQKYQEIIEVY